MEIILGRILEKIQPVYLKPILSILLTFKLSRKQKYTLIMQKEVTFYMNPFYDSVFFQMTEFRIPTRIRSKRGREELKENERIIVNGISDMVIKNPSFYPFTGKLFVVLSICGKEDYLKWVDIDNLQKLILDACTGRVFKDDNQVYAIYASKNIMESNGFFMGIKKVEDIVAISGMIPSLFSNEPYK